MNHKKSSYQVIWLLVLICAPLWASDRIITPHHDWCISSPAITNSLALRSPASPTTAHGATLSALGTQANEMWRTTTDAQERIIGFEHIFSSVDRAFLLGVIDEIIADEQRLQEVTQASYKNVTGFLKVVLTTGGKDGWKIRLHVWENKEPKEFPHNHKWDFYSKIMSGYLCQEVYAKTDACNRAKPYAIREPVSLMPVLPNGELPCPCRDNYILMSKSGNGQPLTLTVQSKTIIGTGESYYMPNHLIHTISPGRGAISLVFTSEKVNNNSEVFVPADKIKSELTYHAPSVTTEELKAELLRIKKMLQQLHIHAQYLPEMTHPQHLYFHKTNQLYAESDWRLAINQSTASKRVVQLAHDEMQPFAVSCGNDGRVLIGGKAAQPESDYLFVLLNNTMYATPKDFHHESDELLCHTSFTDYGPVDSAGVLRFDKDGHIATIEAYSGHYAPSTMNMTIARDHLARIGIATDRAHICAYYDRPSN